jgi:hypothetical protein
MIVGTERVCFLERRDSALRVGGVGRVPRLPGTVASIVGAGLACWLSPNPAMQIAGCLAVTALGFWSAGPAARRASCS